MCALFTWSEFRFECRLVPNAMNNIIAFYVFDICSTRWNIRLRQVKNRIWCFCFIFGTKTIRSDLLSKYERVTFLIIIIRCTVEFHIEAVSHVLYSLIQQLIIDKMIPGVTFIDCFYRIICSCLITFSSKLKLYESNFQLLSRRPRAKRGFQC